MALSWPCTLAWLHDLQTAARPWGKVHPKVLPRCKDALSTLPLLLGARLALCSMLLSGCLLQDLDLTGAAVAAAAR